LPPRIPMVESGPVSLKSLKMEVGNIAVSIGNLEASAAVTVKLRQPLQDMSESDMYRDMVCCSPYGGALGYDNGPGSVAVLAGPYGGSIAGLIPQNSLHQETLDQGISTTNLVELNISDMALKDGSGNEVSAGALSVTGTNADTYRINGGQYAPGEYEFAQYSIDEDADTLTIENKFGTAVYTFEADDSAYGGTISCEKEVVHALATDEMVGFYGGVAQCADDQVLQYPAGNITEWVESIQENEYPSMGLDYDSYQVELVDGAVVNENFISASYNGPFGPLTNELNPLMLKVDAAATIDFAAQGDVDPEATPVAISLTHSGLDQSLEFSIGAGLMTGSYATYAPVLEVNSKVEEQGGLFDAQFTIDRMVSIAAYNKFSNNELSEAEQKQLADMGYVRFKAGEVTMDGQVVAEIQYLAGPGINTDDNPSFANDDQAYRLEFSDGSAPSGDVFVTVENFATVCVSSTPESGEGEVVQARISECTPTPVTETGVFSFKAVFDAFYGSVGAYEDGLLPPPLQNPFPSEDELQ